MYLVNTFYFDHIYNVSTITEIFNIYNCTIKYQYYNIINRSGLVNIGARCELFLRGLFSDCSS